jgi:hypothetical protein
MLSTLFQYIQDIFKSRQNFDNLEVFIASANPQSAEDVDRLEHQFYERRRNNIFTYFHE